MQQVICNHCNRAFNAPDATPQVRCPYCNNVVNVNSQGQYQQPPYGQPQYAYDMPNMPMSDIGVFDVGPSGKSRGVAGLLAILLGGLGVHYFYCGHALGGVLCILLSLVTCGAWSVITLIQGILFLCMQQDEFERKYVHSTSTMPLF